jgi:uncharacterized membrane protein
MTQKEFLDSLKAELEKNAVANIPDILNDYREHFTHALEGGKSEETISAKLGSPVVIAKAYQTEVMISQVKNSGNQFQWGTAFQVLVRLIVIAPFNFFVLFIPGLILFTFLTVGWSMVFASGCVAAGIFGALFKLSIDLFSFWVVIAIGSASFATFGAAFLGGLIMFTISKFILLAVINYLQWNLKFILEK